MRSDRRLASFLPQFPMDFPERPAIEKAAQLLRTHPVTMQTSQGALTVVDVPSIIADLNAAYDRCSVNSPSSAQSHISNAIAKLRGVSG